jgi:hypothetical protein
MDGDNGAMDGDNGAMEEDDGRGDEKEGINGDEVCEDGAEPRKAEESRLKSRWSSVIGTSISWSGFSRGLIPMFEPSGTFELARELEGPRVWLEVAVEKAEDSGGSLSWPSRARTSALLETA